MKALMYIWLIVAGVLLVAGLVWFCIDRKSESRKKAPWILMAVGELLVAAFFLMRI